MRRGKPLIFESTASEESAAYLVHEIGDASCLLSRSCKHANEAALRAACSREAGSMSACSQPGIAVTLGHVGELSGPPEIPLDGSGGRMVATM